MNFVTKQGTEIEKVIVDKILQMNSERMMHKGRKAGRCDVIINNIYKFSQSYGCVAYIEIDGFFDGIDFVSSISRAVFESMNADLFRKTI